MSYAQVARFNRQNVQSFYKNPKRIPVYADHYYQPTIHYSQNYHNLNNGYRNNYGKHYTNRYEKHYNINSYKSPIRKQYFTKPYTNRFLKHDNNNFQSPETNLFMKLRDFPNNQYSLIISQMDNNITQHIPKER